MFSFKCRGTVSHDLPGKGARLLRGDARGGRAGINLDTNTSPALPLSSRSGSDWGSTPLYDGQSGMVWLGFDSPL